MNRQEKPIASLGRTREIMTEFKLSARKNIGQNFIIEPEIVKQIAESAHLDMQTAVIEIGPGIGALSQQLAQRAGKVLCFEIDERLKPVLEKTLQAYNNVEVVFKDFLQLDLLDCVSRLRKNYQKVVVCANLPYYITTPLLFHIFDSPADIPYITVMMQKEVGERLLAVPNTKEYNALSVIVQYRYKVKQVMKVSKNIFIPKPKVDSVVLQFTKQQPPQTVKDERAFYTMVKTSFTQRRKTIYNNLKILSADMEVILTAAGIDPSRRAESLSLEEFINLFEVYCEKESICEN